ncbi:translation initiation factor IF-2 [Oncorhynchus tshawytscha]|uniref:translation initiation factor IF-2 n=1 Tax=Oncorhynchus tshawytscha TaxID=74940 RepID=UPI000D0A727E|nr:translation initiation factor IF-2 [Oncorhynchus tshawytscha]
MAEKCPKSKLKRKKLSIEEPLTDIFSRNTLIKNNESSSASIKSLRSTRPVVPTETWWSRGDLAAVESLWALTLSSALPCLDAHPWDPVPDLPTASTLSSNVDQQIEWRWCSLSEDMTPLPSSPSSPLSTSTAPHCSTPDSPLNPSPGLEKTLLPVPLQTSQTTSTINGPPSKSAPCLEGPGEGTSSSGAGPHRPPSLGAKVPSSYRRGGPWSGGGVSSRKDTKRGEGGQNTAAARPHPTARRPGGEKESHPSTPQLFIRAGNGGSSLPAEARKGGGGGDEGDKRGMKRLQLPANQVDATSSTSDSFTAAPMEEGEKTEEGVSGMGRADWVAGKGGGGRAMQSCPMCLVPFPAGFTQMDCDSHLAKCLSEMTLDMTW